MNRKNLIKGLLLSLGVIFLQSCDKDFNTIGSGVIGEPGFDLETYTVSDFVAYNQAMGENNIPAGIESTNLTEINFGSYHDPIFGTTTASFVTATAFPTAFPSAFGANARIDSVYVYIPYYGEYDKKGENNINLYKLNNVYGKGSFNVKVYENGYYLFNTNAGGANDLNRFFSNDIRRIDQVKKTTLLNDSQDPKQNTNFVFDNKEIVVYKRDKDGNIIKEGEEGNQKEVIAERHAPGVWLDLNKEYFQRMFFENQDKFKDVNSFNNFFRGLFFSVTPNNGSEGAIGKLNFANANLVVKYSQDAEKKEGDDKVTRERKTISFGINRAVPNVNFFENNYSPNYLQNLANKNTIDGNENLHLKGGNGSVAILDIFNKDNQEELKRLKDQKLMINEAILTVYVDKNAMRNSEFEPARLYLFNIDENKLLADFGQNGNALGGVLEKGTEDDDKKGIRYRFRITDHIRNLLKKEQNYSPKLGLMAVDSYSNSTDIVVNKMLKEEINNKPSPIKAIPAIGAFQPLGTILHGTTSSDESKKMKLEIFYTKSKN